MESSQLTQLHLMGTGEDPQIDWSAMSEADANTEVHRRFDGQVLRYSPTNGVIKFDPASFNPEDPRHGRFEWQFGGNHFTRGITLEGFVRLLTIMGWHDYDIAERQRHNLSWLNDGEKNGYDLTEVVIPAYMNKIGMQHLSLVEAIESEQVGELACLKDHVGPADVFFSHVQKLPLTTTLKTLRQLDDHFKNDISSLFRISRDDRELGLRHFIDYTCLRQCLSEDFTIENVVSAIDKIGMTVAELDVCIDGETALLQRIFCILEIFATVRGDSPSLPQSEAHKLVTLGPLFDMEEHDQERVLMLARAQDLEIRKQLIDSSSARCRWKEEEDKIKEYILQNGGFEKIDWMVADRILDASSLRALPHDSFLLQLARASHELSRFHLETSSDDDHDENEALAEPTDKKHKIALRDSE